MKSNFGPNFVDPKYSSALIDENLGRRIFWADENLGRQSLDRSPSSAVFLKFIFSRIHFSQNNNTSFRNYRSTLYFICGGGGRIRIIFAGKYFYPCSEMLLFY